MQRNLKNENFEVALLWVKNSTWVTGRVRKLTKSQITWSRIFPRAASKKSATPACAFAGVGLNFIARRLSWLPRVLLEYNLRRQNARAARFRINVHGVVVRRFCCECSAPRECVLWCLNARSELKLLSQALPRGGGADVKLLRAIFFSFLSLRNHPPGAHHIQFPSHTAAKRRVCFCLKSAPVSAARNVGDEKCAELR